MYGALHTLLFLCSSSSAFQVLTVQFTLYKSTLVLTALHQAKPLVYEGLDMVRRSQMSRHHFSPRSRCRRFRMGGQSGFAGMSLA